ncbi:unnamed protein product, partial [Mesorhabditis belari]|uniref:Carboxylesterase type B domain-containing protein n=1 Tax=Mesorhabditis belari TaxID=2138241 RepID=A0AAF3FMG7_9BILA
MVTRWAGDFELRLLLRTFLSLLIYLFPSPVLSALRKTHPIELTINSGSIRGENLVISGNDYAIFKGVPYAAPPVGALRFAKPQPPAIWRGFMNATQYSAMCVQRTEGRPTDPERHTAHFSEDCLYLNIYAPTRYFNDTYPVIVFIHGGNFQTGGGNDYSQQAILENFVSRKILFVTFNYRLGPFGFLSTGEKEAPGNLGLHDQILALKWVKQNADVFGGDPDNVLLMGEGSGAASASILALSPIAEGLFHRILLLSGTAVSPGMVRDTAIKATEELDKKLQCRSFNSSELLDCWRKKMKEEILNADDHFFDDYDEFVPIVDGVGGVIPEAPELLATYRRKVPIMLGTTKDESSLRIVILNEKNVNFTALTTEVAERLADNLTTGYHQLQNHGLVANGCKQEYIWTKVDPSMDSEVLFNSTLRMFSHFWYDAPATRLAAEYAKAEQPVYLYSFDHISENFYHKRAFHGVDVIHLFNLEPRFLNRRKDMNWQLDQRVIEIFSELVANFARFGNPTPENSGFAFNWTQVEMEELNYLSITDTPTMEVGFRWSGHMFWNTYARTLDVVDIGNMKQIASLEKKLADFQLATWMLLCCSGFFFTILVGLACYCTRKESDEDEI